MPLLHNQLYNLHRCKSYEIANPNKKRKNQNAKKNMRKKITYLKRFCKKIFIYMNVEMVET
jgi:hypothetical protein